MDDLLVISHDPQKVMDFMSSKYTLKAGSVGVPTSFLGATISKWRIEDSDDPEKTRWAMSCGAYVSWAIDDVERELELCGEWLIAKDSTPLSMDYRA